MKKFGILIMMLFVLGVVFTTTLKAQTEEAVEMDSVSIREVFAINPYLYAHAYSDPWAKSALMQKSFETFNNVWDYQRKQTKEMCWGLGIGAVGIAGMVYAVNMPIPVRQVNNPDLDEAADQAQRDRRIVGVSSIVVGTVGAVIFARSFRWTKRLKGEIGLQSLRLEYNLTGNRRYFNKTGSHPKKLKNSGLYPRYKR